MRKAYSIMAVLAALLLATAGGGGGAVYICIGADGHVGLKSTPRACGECCEGRVSADCRGGYASDDCGGGCASSDSPRDDRASGAGARFGGAPHDCDCVDIAIRVDHLSPAPVKPKPQHSQPTAAPTLARSTRIRTADVRPPGPAPHAHTAISLLHTVVLLV